MKLLRLLPLLILTACASHAPHKRNVVSVTEPIGQPANAAMLRTPEQLKEYRFGRYVDPGDTLVMHESHPVYRVETSAGWNLVPGNAAASPVHLSTAVPTATARDAVIAEINKQRASSRAFADEMAKLNQRLAAMAQMAASMSALAQQNLALRSEIATVRDRLDALDSQGRQSQPVVPNATPAADKW